MGKLLLAAVLAASSAQCLLAADSGTDQASSLIKPATTVPNAKAPYVPLMDNVEGSIGLAKARELAEKYQKLIADRIDPNPIERRRAKADHCDPERPAAECALTSGVIAIPERLLQLRLYPGEQPGAAMPR